MPTLEHRIALIHALEESVGPIRAAFSTVWPEAFTFDLMDTSLAIDRAAVGKVDGAMARRFDTLARYASEAKGQGGQTEAILFTCSAFGSAIDAVKARLDIPVLRPNEAAFSEALDQGDRIGLIVSFLPSRDMLRDELMAMAAAAGRQVSIEVVLAEGALEALKSGDGVQHDALIAQAAESLGAVDVLVLGQFSMARAADGLRGAGHPSILTTPESAVRAMRAKLVNS
jgi:Asp/Glu/hydantoin racemase